MWNKAKVTAKSALNSLSNYHLIKEYFQLTP